MPLAPGFRLGSHEIAAKLGEGGMGEVYRATDTRLRRSVAIKVLPTAFTADHDRLSRFEREAQLLASLNHPNIAHVYGFESATLPDGSSGYFIAMELVEGEDLAERLKRGPIALDEAMAIARQIAEAFEEAHERGIIHRDLKPANVKITPDGKVKVLDFGLAKAMDSVEAGFSRPGFSRPDQSPTLTARATQLGMIIGTAAYMAPEQARGKPVDKRADIWAFGVVLYEMLTGTRAFGGEDTSDVLAAVLRQEVDWKSVPPETPPRLRRLLERCLERDARTRLRDIGEARVEIAKIESGDRGQFAADASSAVIPRDAWRNRLGWITSAVLAIALVAAVWMLWTDRNRNLSPAARPVRLVFDPPANLSFDGGLADSLAVSPDGRLLVFTGRSPDGQRQLWTQSLESGETKALAGTEDPLMPFWSPDSRSIGFGSKGKLRRVDLAGGRPEVIANAPRLTGGSWNRNGMIIFAPDFNVGVAQVSANGGDVKTITTPDAKRGELIHRAPVFLPDGRQFLYNGGRAGEREIWWGSLDSADRRRLTNGGDPRYAQGWLLFIRDGTVVAQAFDPGPATLAGDPIPVGVSGPAEIDVPLSASENGVLVFKRPFTPEHRLSWFDRTGRKLGDVGQAVRVALSLSPRLSPDETRVVMQNREPEVERRGIWVHDLARGVSTRLSSRLGQYPQWSPDGTRLAWLTRNDKDVIGIYEKRANGVGDESLLVKIGADVGGTTFPTDWSSDGRFLLYYARSERTRIDIWALPLFGDRKPYPVLNTEFDEHQGQLSPDGHWLAYRSDVDGSYEIYVRSFTAEGKVGTERRRISTGGGSQPRFRRDGRELFYLADDGWMMAVALTTTATTFDSKAPTRLFKARMLTRGFEPQFEYDVTRDGQRFLIGNILDGPEGSPPRPMVILNWTAGLPRK